MSEKSEEIMKHPINPLDVVTGRFRPERIVHENRGFVIAVGYWKGQTLPGVGIRWHTPGEIGYPNGFGKPQWMETPIFPEDIQSLDNPILPNAIQITMLGDTRSLSVGGWAYDGLDWHLITYVYGEGTGMVKACGLGKATSYPLEVSRISKVEEGRSTMDYWFKTVAGDDACLWLAPTGRIYITLPTTREMIWMQHNPQNCYTRFELTKSPATGQWGFSGTEPAVFDYMLDECLLLGRRSYDREKSDTTTNMCGYFETILAELDLPGLHKAYCAGDLSDHRRHFVADLTGAQKSKVFAHDVVMGSAYYDLTSK